MFRRVAFDEIRDFLIVLDQHLNAPARLVVIGGYAVALSGFPARATSDVDLFNNPGPDFWAAVEACKNVPGAVPISQVGISSQPYDFEDRLQPIEDRMLPHLRLYIPEAHDLAIMKLARGEAHDTAALVAMHAATPLDLYTLVQRYRDTDYIGPPERFKISLLSLVETLFGVDAARSLEAELG